MAVPMPLSIGFLSTYPPTQCGLATFTSALRAQLAASGSRCGVVRVVDRPETSTDGGVDVVDHLVPGAVAAQANAATALNEFDVVIVQHEFGIYGGADGDEVLDLLDRLTAAVIVVAHTVPGGPTRHQRDVLESVARRADAVVTMTMTARRRLVDSYDVEEAKVVVIPHGATHSQSIAPQIPVGPATILTWGLLGPGKGIESVIEVLPSLRGLDRQPVYRVVGQTHPRVLEREGEAYRGRLVVRAAALGVADLVIFESSYLDLVSLHRVVAQADVVVLPYESKDQATSGVLTEAVAAGKPVVATAFPHAVELLDKGVGLVVPHGDSNALARALRRVLVEPGLAASMAAPSSLVAGQLRWSSVAARYRELAGSLLAVDATVAA